MACYCLKKDAKRFAVYGAWCGENINRKRVW
jgi:hypothetical protein